MCVQSHVDRQTAPSQGLPGISRDSRSPLRFTGRVVLAVLIAIGLGGCGRGEPEGSAPQGKGQAVVHEPETSQAEKGAIPPEQIEAVLEAHYRGIGRIEQDDYQGAVEAFREVHKRAPNWLPGSINLAIALMNGVGEEGPGEKYKEESLNLFDSILARQPENLHAHFCRGILLNERDLNQRAHADFQFVVEKAPEDGYAWYWLADSARKQDPIGAPRSTSEA